MTFKEMQDEVIVFRFNEAKRTYVKRWVNQRMNWVWGASDWPFKYVTPTNLTITASDPTPTLPSDYGRTLALYDDSGDALSYQPPELFWTMYPSITTPGQPSDFTVVDGAIYLGPTPASSATFQLAYERALCYRASGSTITAGLMVNDNDTPIWSERHHYLLVQGALSSGLKAVNDPTWEALESEFTNAFTLMQNDLLPPDRSETLQFGRDRLGYEAWLA